MHAITKRTIDIVLASIALVATAPLMLLIAVAVKLDSPGPVLYPQRRLGKDGRPFTMLKFRSMTHNADDAPHREAIRRAANGERTQLSNGKHVFKTPDDPRVTRLGRILRPTCLDELPQVINVLLGEMSIVGPRPALEYELAYYRDWHHRRFAVRPGITGSWQVMRSKAENFEEMLAMDVEYTDSASIATDLKLIAMTIPAIVRERGVF